MSYTEKQRKFFHAAAERGEPGMKKMAGEADKLSAAGKERPPVKAAHGGSMMKRYAMGGGVRRPFAHEIMRGAPMSYEDHKGDQPGHPSRLARGGIVTSHTPVPFSREYMEPVSFEDMHGEEPGRFASGGPITDGYEGEEGEASYRDGTESREEMVAEGGMVECPNCGSSFNPQERVSVHRGDGEESEEGSQDYAAHGEPGQYEPEESFGAALRRKYGRSEM